MFNSKLLPLALFLLSSPAWATWTLTQVKDTVNCTSPCAVTVTSTGAGHLLVAAIVGPNTNNTISAVTSAACTSTWTHAANSAAGTAVGSTDIYYCLNSASGQTSISITIAGTACGGACQVAIWELSSSLGNIAVDTGATPAGTVTSCLPTNPATSCNGISLTLSGNNDFIAIIGTCGGTCSGVTGTGYTNDFTPSGDDVAHGLNITTTTTTAPATFTQTSGNFTASAAAFQESSGVVACNNFRTLMGAGCR